MPRTDVSEFSSSLLPTPQARDYKGPNPFREGGLDLPSAVKLLPTPAACDSTNGGAHPDTRGKHTLQLIDVALLDGEERWGQFTPAIERWETLTRPAPAATEPTSKGNKRLTVEFAEWMMGWPEGWVSDLVNHGPKRNVEGTISRSAALKTIGNGVCVSSRL